MQLAVEVVGAAFGNGVEHSSRSVPHRCVEAAGLHFELGDRILGQLESDQRTAATVEESVRYAVNRVLIRIKLIAIRGELGGGAVERALALPQVGAVDHSRR